MMFEQIEHDARAGRFEGWGLSTVIDEHVGLPLITREDFDDLHRAAGLAATWPIGNAGLIHVYGYLLSEVPTEYGLKRERWERGELAEALGRPRREFLLADAAAAGETVLRRVGAAVLGHLQDPAAERGDILIFDDVLEPASADADDPRGTFFRTVVVQRAPEAPAALIYGVHDGTRMRAITTFPLASVTPESLAAFAADPPRMRYNAALAAVAPRTPLRRAAR